MPAYFCYREARNTAELEALLRLRYTVYRSSRLAGFCPENPWGLDLDAYDPCARHFGLFHCEEGRQRPVGYMRVIQAAETPAAAWVRRIARRHSEVLFQKVTAERPNPFPVMNYFPGAQERIRNLHRHAQAKGEYVCEGSRFIVDPAYCSARLGIHLIEASIAIYFFALGFQHAVISCSEHHTAAYRRYFFEPMEGTVTQDIRAFTGGGASLLLSLSFKEKVDIEIKHRIAQMSSVYRRFGRICFHPGHPGEYAPPGNLSHSNETIFSLNRQSKAVRLTSLI